MDRGGKDLTQGPIASTLLLFALPTLGSNILQSLNGSINTIWVGRFLGERAVAATTNANIIMFPMFSTVFGLGMASTVLIGQATGARDMDSARRAFGSALGFCFLFSLLISIAGWFGAPTLLHMLATPAEAFDPALAYLRVIFISMPATLLSIMMTMGVRGIGDARTPFYFMLLNVGLDLVLNPVLILGFGPIPAMGIAGSAGASAVAGFISFVALVAYTYRRDLPIRLRGAEWAYLRPSMPQLRILVGKGLPMGLQMIVASVSGILMIGLVNREGLLATAAYGAAQQLWSYLQMPAMAIGGAVSAMAAQNVGAGRWDRIGRIANYGLCYLLGFTGVMVALMLWFHHPLLALFLGGSSPAIPMAWHMQLIASWSFILFGGAMIYFGIMRANGVVMMPLIIMILSLFVARLGFYVIAYPRIGPDALWWSFPAGSATALVLAAAVYYRGGWRKARLMVPPTDEECVETANSEAEPTGRIVPVG